MKIESGEPVVGRARKPRRVSVALAVLAGLAVSSSVQALYVADEDVDNTYPNVGTFVLIGTSTGPYQFPDLDLFTACSGSLIGQDLFLTARHCAEWFEGAFPDYEVYVTLDPDPMDGLEVLRPDTELLEVSNVLMAPPIGGLSLDLAVFELKRPAKKSFPGVKPVRITEEGVLDALVDQGANPVMSYAGYGHTGSSTDGWWDAFYGKRHYGEKALYGISGHPDPWWLDLDPAEEYCILYGETPGAEVGPGDSGMPVFWINPAGQRVQVGVGHDGWWGGIVATRLDHPLAQVFLDCVFLEGAERDACLADLPD